MSEKKAEPSWRSAYSPNPTSQNPPRAQIHGFDEHFGDIVTETEHRDTFQTSGRQFDTETRASPRTTRKLVDDDEPYDSRVGAFSSMKKRFEDGNNNGTSSPPPAVRNTKYPGYSVPPSRQSWDAAASSTEGRRRSSASSVEYNDRDKILELTEIREQVGILKRELADAQRRRENAVSKYPETKERIMHAKQVSAEIREKCRSLQYQIERREYKTKEKKKRLEVKISEIDQNQRTAAFYSKDIEKESQLLVQVSEDIETAQIRKKANAEKLRDVMQRVGQLKKKIAGAEKRIDSARDRSRKCQDILNKTTIKLKHAREVSANTAERISFKGYRVEDAGKEVEKAKERIKRSKSDMEYLKYRKKLLKDQLQEYRDDLHRLLTQLAPKKKSKKTADYTSYKSNMPYPTNLPMSEEL